MTADILDVFLLIRMELERHGFKPPTVIHLASHEEGVKLLAAVSQQDLLIYAPGTIGRPVETPGGAVWMEVEIFGMKIRWPANRYALEQDEEGRSGFVFG